MKYILLSFYLLTFFNIKAQTTDTVSKDANSSLTESELQTAKEKFIQMMNTETYILYKKCIRENTTKLKGLKFPDPREIDLKDKEQRRKWVNDNISRTDYASVDEGVAMIQKMYDTFGKLYTDNAELYKLIEKANAKQIGEIYKPQHMNDREKLYSGNVD